MCQYKTNKFNYAREKKQNPYSGIMSFQHFRGEKMYSDIVVKPENKYCETERVECYPVSLDAEENGREQGYYPDTTVVYIRVLWKEFEPKQNEYNYQFVEDIISAAREKKQTLIFRLMAHSTREEDDVPEWLKTLMPCPERPAGERVKASPTDPLFIKLFAKAVRALGERFDKDKTFDAIDVSLPGSWGEGCFLERYPEEDIFYLLDTYIEAFPTTRLLGQCHRPEFLKYIGEKNSVGWRGDGLGEPKHTFEIYPERIEKVKDYWLTGPVSFEAYWWLCEWQRKGWDVDAIIEKTLSWHISSFNPKSMPIPIEWQDKIEYWISKMGYHFCIESFSFLPEVKAGEKAEYQLKINNVGVAPCYNKIPVYLRLKGETEYVFKTEIDIFAWMPGEHSEKIQIDIPKNVLAGEYKIELAAFNEVAEPICFATDAPADEEWFCLGEQKIK